MSGALMGEFSFSMDAKGRISLPADWRQTIGESFVITKGLDYCLSVYSKEQWQVLTEKLAKLPLSKKDARSFMRFIFSGAKEVECDKLGRFLVPQNLRQYANLAKEAVLIGVSNRAEIWAKDAWENYSEQVTPQVSEIAETLADLGI